MKMTSIVILKVGRNMTKNNENVSMFKEVFKINLLYSNPAYTEKSMKSEKYKVNPEQLYKDLGVKKHIFLGIFLMLVYTLFFAVIDYSKFPYMIDLSLGIFMLMNIFQTFTYFYNVFYESRDIDGYMVLPIEQSIVFKAKMAVVSISTLELAIPMLPLFIIYMIRLKMGILQALILGFIDFLIVFALIIIANSIAMNIMSRSAILSKFKSKIITSITIITSLINVVFILGIQQISKDMSNKAINGRNIKVVYGPISFVMKKYSSHLIAIALLILLIYVFYKKYILKVENNFYAINRSLNTSSNYNVSKKDDKIGSRSALKINKDINSSENLGYKENMFESKDRGQLKSEKAFKRKTLFKYNLSLISDSTVISQTMMVIIFPIIVLYPQFESLKNLIGDMNPSSLKVFALGLCIIIALMYNVYPNGLHSVILSLDGENYNYIKSLPISEKEYMKNKLIFSTVITAIFSTIIAVAICIYMKVAVAYIILGVALIWIMSYSIGSQWIVYDHKHLLTSWQNTSEIYSRSSKGVNLLIMFVIVIVGSMVIAGIAVAGINMASNYLFVILLLAAIIVSAISLFKSNLYLKKNNIK